MSSEVSPRTPPEGLNVAALISAKGAQLRFWIIKTNEASEKKVLTLSGTVDQQRTRLADYYGFDLTVIPRGDAVTAPTVDESIRDRQWADFVKLGVEWKETVAAGRVFSLLTTPKSKAVEDVSILLAAESHTLATENHESTSQINPLPSHPAASVIEKEPSITVHADNLSINSTASKISTTTNRDMPHHPTLPADALLDDLSKEIEGLARCEGLRDIIQQVESGAVAKIRARYGPSDGRRGTADPSWPKYKDTVSKRERLYRILSEDFAGIPKKRKGAKEEPESLDESEHFRSFRKIVEAAPWCEADLLAEREKEQYHGSNGRFCDLQWAGKWGTMNSWEIWRELGDERYEKTKSSTSLKTMSIARSRLLCQSVRNQGIGDFLIGDPAATGELFASEQILFSWVKAHEKSRRKEANIAAALAERERVKPATLGKPKNISQLSFKYDDTISTSTRWSQYSRSKPKAAKSPHRHGVGTRAVHARVRGSRLPPHPNEINEGKRAKEAGKEKKRVERERRKELRAEIEQEWAEMKHQPLQETGLRKKDLPPKPKLGKKPKLPVVEDEDEDEEDEPNEKGDWAEMKHQHNAAVENWTSECSKLQETGLRKKDLPPKPKLGKKPKLPVVEDEDEDEEDEPNEKGDV
ncbi:hypothetical protein R3P38DRAFT_3453333 [Favolaschia claudopus]|uniref:Uncharacterized protein n=2 Tax=Favolaschia claudopus TaxID=2862362 RepID=A0AAW0CSE0_9AGAR